MAHEHAARQQLRRRCIDHNLRLKSNVGREMKMSWGDSEYWSERFEDRDAGCEGFRLHRGTFGESSVVAEVTFWDATGGFTFRTIDGDLPIEVVNAAIEEAKREIKVR